MDTDLKMLRVDQLQLDISNPRVARYIEMYGAEISAEQMALALGAGDSQVGETGTTFRSLKESIRTNGRVIHPIIVNRGADGELVVIEGNTRTLIYREFCEQGVPGEWERIPAIVYDNLDAADIDAIRLQAHLVGPRQWDPYSKAKYLDYLRNSQHLTMAQVVDFCGGRRREVSDFVQAYHDMERYYREVLDSDDEFDPTRFSAFVELQRERVKQAIQSAGFTYTDFAEWVRDSLLFPLNTVRQLPRILGDERSKSVFLTEGAREALRILDAPTSDAVLSELNMAQLARELAKRVAHLSYEELQRLRADPASEENDILCEAKDSLVTLCADIASDD